MSPLSCFVVILLCWHRQAGVEGNSTPSIRISPSSVNVNEDHAINTQFTGPCAFSDSDDPSTADGTVYINFGAGNFERRFAVAGSTCEFLLVQPLDYDLGTRTYRLSVQARDLGGKRQTRRLTVRVRDVNDNAPTCNPYTILGSLTEEAVVGTQIASFTCSDIDTGSGGDVFYQVVSGDTDVIEVDSTNGQATLKRKLDFDTEAHTYRVEVRVFDGGSPVFSSMAQVLLDLTDVDDNRPVFEKSSYSETVNEDAPVGFTIVRLNTTDADQPGTDNSRVIYGFETSPNPDWLMIDQRTGDLLVKTALDFETSTSISCQVYAFSSDKSSDKAVVNVVVTVLDVNDRVPAFTQTYYHSTVPEDASTGTLVITVSANDPDSGADGQVTYFMSGPTFEIVDPNIGAVTVKEALDFENTTSYLVEVVATDGGLVPQSSTVLLQISITPVNEFDPVFEGTFAFDVLENSIPGTSVHEAQVSDQDSGVDGEILYTVVTPGVPFSVDSETGIIRVAFDLDFETEDSYTFVIQATDKSGTVPRTATATYVGTVLGVDDVPITCDRVTTTVISDATSIGYVVARLTCSDPDDPMGTFTYALTADPDDGTFSMNNADVVLSEVPESTTYSLSILVTDGIDSTNVTFTVLTEEFLQLLNLPDTINVTEGDTGPVPYSFSLTRTFPIAKVEITAGNDDLNAVVFGTSGDLIIALPYDREAQETHTYTVRASTSSNQVAAGTLTVNVGDINDNAPTFGSSLFVVNMIENLPQGSDIATFSATDADIGEFGTVTHSIISGDPSNYFTIDSVSGELSLSATSAIDYETTTLYTLVLRAVDGGPTPKTGSTTVVINVQNFDDVLAIVALVPGISTLTLPEDNALGITVVQIQATDADANTVFSYSIDSGNTDGDFAVDPVSGIVRQVKLLDRERTASYTLVLKATDQNSVSSSASLIITVTDINDNDPAFSQHVYEFNVDHNTGAGVSIGNLSVVDADDGVNAETDVVIEDAGVTGIFSLSGLQVLTDTDMDYDLKRTYSFQVKVTDRGTTSRSGTARVVVNVLPASEPKFDPVLDTVIIEEGTLAGFQVYDLNATVLGNSETDGTMQYVISSATPVGGFTVRSDSGQVVSLVTMDYETSSSYVLNIVACIILDCISKKAEFTLTITLTDINDNTPYFAQGSYSIQAEETATGNTVIDTITAIDEDISSPFNVLTYTLTGTSADFELVDSTSGAIKVANSLNFQSQSEYSYLLSVSDGGIPAKSAQVSVVIQVQDSNTNDPMFTTGSTTTVPDSSPVGSEVFHFHATDADTGPAGELSYGIIADSSGGVFSLDPSTGILTTGQLLDAAVVPSYTLTIQVEDRGTPIRSAQSTLTITVESTVPNNNDPVFSPTVINVGLARDATFGTLVTTALASDADNGNSGELRHKIQAGNSDGYFAIDSQTGQITTVTSVLLANDAYTLTVVAKDNGVPQRSATATVSVAISPPKTTLTTVDYSWTVMENEAANMEVGRIDVDTGRTVTGTYTIELGNFANTFKISLNAGDSRGILKVNVPPDYETKPLFSLLVKVGTDIGDVYKVVQVQVVDTNDEPPVFAQNSYTLTLAENTPAGSTVETISYTDADTDSANRDNILEVKAPGSSLFTIDQLGHLTLLTSPDFESLSTPITFDVTARENKSPAVTATTVVTVNVIDILEEETVPTSDVTDDALISLELPYQSSNGHVLHTLEPGDFGVAASISATYEYLSFPASDPFNIDSSSGSISVTDSSLLSESTKYIRWVVCRSTDGGVSTSKVSLLRIDTFDKDTQMIVIEFSETLANVRAELNGFKSRAQLFFTDTQRLDFAQTFDTNTGGSRRRLLASQSVAYAYAVADTSADDIANINQNKTFLTEAQLLAALQQSPDGSPMPGLSDPSGLPVTTVQQFGEAGETESLWKTPGGIAIICLIILFIVILVVIVIACLVVGKREASKGDVKSLPSDVDSTTTTTSSRLSTKSFPRIHPELRESAVLDTR
ncbi:cadherin-23 [Aplysia californica]|uniref:Cadherin-23 n=1 Tax=Aplysia californica TaxID=6500 RepID=A0ABM0JII7_APLCA|nr:cadherin-23 [Aplysia californica]XP_005094420.1 cadherin-23 [Aplysia californica]XP_035824650.1 cadherin-23 [Aplysia californica]